MDAGVVLRDQQNPLNSWAKSVVGIVESVFEQVAGGSDAGEGRSHPEARKLLVTGILDVDLFVSTREFVVMVERPK